MSEHAAQPTPFASVAVLGPGLLGGSIAKAVQELMPQCELRLWARRLEPLEQARRLGITRHTCTDVQEAVRGAQLIILATPIGTFPSLVQSMLAAVHPDALVTDVGSVKGIVHNTIGQLLAESGHFFIGSHPMAGAEKQGLEHARAELLQGATVALTNSQGAPPELVMRLAAFWQALGCCTLEMEPTRHDGAVARISHMPHVLAALCARNASCGGESPDDLHRLASTGFRDTTRVSSGNPSMWAEILLENADAVQEALADCAADLHRFAALLKAQDKAGILAWLQQAKDARESVQRNA